MTILVGVLAAVLSFGFIVFIHEMGHYLAARWAGIRAPYFAIGFGPKLAAFRRWGTEFSIRGIPLGGYVMMVGEDPSRDGEEGWHATFSQAVGELQFPITPREALERMVEPQAEVEEFLRSLPPDKSYASMEDLEGNFNFKSTWQRTVVILGGVTMNFLAATLLLLGLGLSVGLGVIQEEVLPRVAEVVPGSPAATAGLKVGDSLVRLDGMSVVSGADFVAQMSMKVGKRVKMDVMDSARRASQLEVTPDLSLAEHYFFRTQARSGATELVRVEGVAVPSGLKLPFAVTHVQGKPLTQGLVELRGWAVGAKKLELSGPQGSWTLDEKAGFNPRAVVGVRLARVTSFGFESRATNEVIGVLPNSQAERAGVRKGDLLYLFQGVEVSGGETQLDTCLKRCSERILRPGEAFKLVVIRDKEIKDLLVDEVPLASARQWGVELRPVTTGLVLTSTARVLGMILSVPFHLARGLYTDLFGTFSELKQSSTGPIGIMQQIFEVSDEGLPELLFLVAILNAFIAVFNLLPIPALDGSRCLFIWLGALRGKALDPEKEARIHLVGILVLLTLALLVSFQDVKRLIAGTSLMK